MNRQRIATIVLAIAGSCSSLMGAYHFFLPSMFHWDMFVTKIPGAIRWGLFSINFFFSYLLLTGGILTFVAMSRLHRSLRPDCGLLIAMAGFWIMNTVYQLVIPMPLPPTLWVLHFVLVGYAVVTAMAYIVALSALRKQ